MTVQVYVGEVGPFPANQEPVHIGVYKRKFTFGDRTPIYVWSRWDGKQWLGYCFHHENAEKETLPSLLHTVWWGKRK